MVVNAISGVWEEREERKGPSRAKGPRGQSVTFAIPPPVHHQSTTTAKPHSHSKAMPSNTAILVNYSLTFPIITDFTFFVN